MEKIELDGEVYYFINNKFVDSMFCAVPDEIAKKLSYKFFKKYDYENYSKEEILEFVKNLKTGEQYQKTKEVCEYALSKFGEDESFVKTILPITVSTYRALHQSHLAISVAQKYTDLFKCDSSALWTSVAAAYCDVGEYKQSLTFIKLAVKKQRQTRLPSFELKEVIKRVAKSLNMTKQEILKIINVKDEEETEI